MNCPECSESVTGSTCKCGWTQQRKNGPPQVEPVLADALRWAMRRHRLPSYIPQEPGEVVRWWIGMQEPRDGRFERPQQLPVVGKDKAVRWYSPYIERVVRNLLHFMQLGEKDQRYIIAAKQDKIYWRGESMKDFYNTVKEVECQRKVGTEAYREEARAGWQACSMKE